MNKLKEGPLLNEKGHLVEAGYAFHKVKRYARGAVKKSALRIKEWDYYYLEKDDVGIALTVADNGYMGLLSVTLLNLSEGVYRTKSKMKFFPLGKFNLSEVDDTGLINVITKKFSVQIIKEEHVTRLHAKVFKFNEAKETLELTASLQEAPRDSVVVAIPFHESKKHFYYNQKVLGYRVRGTLKVGDALTVLDDGLGLLDYGRGVWPYKNAWIWGAGMARVGEDLIAFNIGYGFGDTSNVSENMVFKNGEAYKLDRVSVKIEEDEKGRKKYLAPWQFTSNDQGFEGVFTPKVDREDKISLALLKSEQHQVFGKFSGQVRFKEETMTLKDFPCFVEVIVNHW